VCKFVSVISEEHFGACHEKLDVEVRGTRTSSDITKATLERDVNSVSTAGSFNVDYVNGT
jgi:hypothetical protein